MELLKSGANQEYKRVAKIRDWSVETNVELLSTNAIDSVTNTYTPGVKSATGSATLIYYRLEAGERKFFHEFSDALQGLMRTGAITENHRVRLRLNVGAGADNDIVFDAYITSAQVGVSTGELSIIPIQFTMDGDFVVAKKDAEPDKEFPVFG
jgi:hypothetical protein